jgi:hypothetical protein
MHGLSIQERARDERRKKEMSVRCYWCGKRVDREAITDLVDEKELCYTCSTRLHNYFCCWKEKGDEEEDDV